MAEFTHKNTKEMDKNVYRHQLKGVIEFRYVADKEQKKEKNNYDR